MKLSIITINYNDSEGLKKTLESIKSQSFKDFEQIVIDGGSQDNSVEIISFYENMATYPFYWVSEKDKGVYNAQNKGIMKSQGEYCLFLNAGDYFVDNNVLTTIFSNKSDADIIWGNLVIIDGNEILSISKGKRDVSFLDIYSGIIKHQASFIKRKLFDIYGLYDESLKIVADWDFFMKTIGFNNILITYFDVNIAYFENNGISSNNPELCAQERKSVLDKYMSKILQKDYLIFEKYRNIKYIDRSSISRFIFRVLGKICKIF